jgi:hypothetical protein
MPLCQSARHCLARTQRSGALTFTICPGNGVRSFLQHIPNQERCKRGVGFEHADTALSTAFPANGETGSPLTERLTIWTPTSEPVLQNPGQRSANAGAGDLSDGITYLNEYQLGCMGQSRVKAVTQKAIAGGHCACHRAVPLPIARTVPVGPVRRFLRIKVENRHKVIGGVSPNTNGISRPYQIGMRIKASVHESDGYTLAGPLD